MTKNRHKEKTSIKMVGLNLMIANINISGINTPLSNSIKENDQTICFLKRNTL